jgi:glycosyltransferase involved in cell wall biosynthesis
VTSASPALLSVVVPSFNQGRWLDACLASLFAQEDDALEVIVVDGGSTDGTPGILERWRPRLAGCVVGEDSGQADAIGIGFARARGELLAWLNSDDLHLPWTIRRWRDAFERDSALGFVHGDRVVVDADGRVSGRRALPGHSARWLNLFPWTHQETACGRRGLYESVGGIDRSLRFAMDYDLFSRMLVAGRGAHLRGPLAAFRWHPASKTATESATTGAAEVAEVRRRRGIPALPRLHPMRIAMAGAVRLATRVGANDAGWPGWSALRTGAQVAECVG